jgi:GTP-binding protein YchF
MLIGIVGLPNSSKTTVFNALTGGDVGTAAFSTGGFSVHRAVVDVPDERVDRLSAMFRPRKTIHARVEYKDIGGLAKGISAGGLAGELLGAVSQTDALLHVVRAFEDPDVAHPEGGVDPARDVALLDAEFLLSDLVLVEKRLERLADQLRRPGGGPERAANEAEQALLKRVQAWLEAERPLRDLDLEPEEEKSIRGFQLLSAKPLLLVLNTGDADVADAASILDYPHRRSAVVTLRGRLEAELALLEGADRTELMAAFGVAVPGLERVIRLSYELLGLQSFFTVGEDEVRAWTIPLGATAVEAAGTIHSDLARGFIRAEVVHYEDLADAGSLAEAKRQGRLRLEGRDYLVKDGDVLNIRFKV